MTTIYRLYVRLSLETIVATAVGENIDAQTTAREDSNLVTVTNEFVNTFLESMSNSAEELTVILCKWIIVVLVIHMGIELTLPNPVPLHAFENYRAHMHT